MKNTKRQWSFAIGLVCLIVGTGFTFRILNTPRVASLADLHWDRVPGMIALNNVTRDGKMGTLLVRISDGKEQFFNGLWNVAMSDYGSAFVFQDKPSSTSTPHTIYYVEGSERITALTIDNSGGAIIDIKENPTRTYISIGLSIGDATSYCVLERVPSSGVTIKPICTQLTISKVSTSMWNPSKERELILLTTDGELFSFDPWEKRPKKISATEQKAEYDTRRALFVDTTSLSPLSEAFSQKFFHLPGFIFVVNNNNQGIVVVPIPFDALVGWIDQDHLLLKSKESLFVLEYKKNKQAEMFSGEVMQAQTVFFHNPGIDRKW